MSLRLVLLVATVDAVASLAAPGAASAFPRAQFWQTAIRGRTIEVKP